MRWLYALGVVLLRLALAGCQGRYTLALDRNFQIPLPDCWQDATVRRCFAVDRVGGVVWIDDWANDQLLVRRYDGSLLQTVSYRHKTAFGQPAESFWAHLVLSLACVPKNGVYVLSGTHQARVTLLDHDGNIVKRYQDLKIAYVSGLLQLHTDEAGNCYVIERLGEMQGGGAPFAVGLTKCGGDGTRIWQFPYASWPHSLGVGLDGTSYHMTEPDTRMIVVRRADGDVIRHFPLDAPQPSYKSVYEIVGIDRNQRIFVLQGLEKRCLTVYDNEGNIIFGPRSLADIGGADRTPVKIDDLGGVYFVRADSEGLYLARLIETN